MSFCFFHRKLRSLISCGLSLVRRPNEPHVCVWRGNRSSYFRQTCPYYIRSSSSVQYSTVCFYPLFPLFMAPLNICPFLALHLEIWRLVSSCLHGSNNEVINYTFITYLFWMFNLWIAALEHLKINNPACAINFDKTPLPSLQDLTQGFALSCL
jgi:hypothetical protein